MSSVTFHASRLYQSGLALLGLAVVLGIVWLLVAAEQADSSLWRGFLVFAALFFGLCTVRGLYTLVRGLESLTLGPHGFHATAWAPLVSWDQLEAVYILRAHKQPLICFVLKDAALEMEGWPWFGRVLSRVNRYFGYGDICLSTRLYKVSHDSLKTAVFDAFQCAVPDVERSEGFCARRDWEADR